MSGIEFTLADPDFYVPPERWQAGPGYAPRPRPAGWERHDRGLWTQWTPNGHVLAPQGWKVHVSAQLERTQPVLDVVAAICVDQGVVFKHLRNRQCFLWLHHKHGPRQQSGKFIAAYPADEEQAGRLLRALEPALATERGPYVLTDRRFGASHVVSYRYGAFTPRFRLRPDGSRSPVMLTQDGVEVVDDRAPRFQLPAGISDPFAPPSAETGSQAVSFHGYTFTAVLQYSNAGGAYRARAADGREVFVKEARQDNGYQWSGSSAAERLHQEYLTLRELHDALPGVAPEPLEYFQHWENHFLVTELVPGRSLWSWAVEHSPLIRTVRDPAVFTAYYDNCRRVLDRLAEQIELLHAAGYAFVDLNPRNVLVDGDRPRLIDFEEAHRIDRPRMPHGAEGYLPRPAPGTDPAALDARDLDEYALAAVAQLLLHPLHPVLDRNPEAAAHLAADLPWLPPDLWFRATHKRSRGSTPRLPTPEQVAEEPDRWLAWLRDRVRDGLLTSLDPSQDPPYPITPQSHLTNAYGVAHGLAGIAHVLNRSGATLAGPLLNRFRDDVCRDRESLPPGLFTGLAGIAWVLAEHGRLDTARELLAAADRHPITDQDAGLAHGRAGVALAHLALFRQDDDPEHLTRAEALLTGRPDPIGPGAGLDDDDPTGWYRGRPGIALALYYLARATGERAGLERGRQLLLADLEQAYTASGGMQFWASRTDSRVEPYLATGSAGFALVAGRYRVAFPDDESLAAAFESCRETMAAITAPVLPSLFNGLSGLGMVASDLAAITGDDRLRVTARRSARSLFKYTVPRDGGICFLSAGGRISADLADGGAGVLLFLDDVCDRRPDALFTLDRRPPAPPADRRPAAVPTAVLAGS